MSTEYTVQRGEQLSQIAERFGFENYETIWNHPDNEHLREARESPHELLEGDIVMIPEKKVVPFERNTASFHRFKVHIDELTLRLRLVGLDGEPLADTACTLEYKGGKEEGQTDGDGAVEFVVPRNLTVAVVKTEENTFPLRIGHLDPVSEPTGQQARLINLDYLEGPLGDASPAEVKDAVRRFQADNELEATGKLDDETLDKLVEVYGA